MIGDPRVVTPFPPQVKRHEGNPGDDEQREIWALFQALMEKRLKLKETKKRVADAAEAVRFAEHSATQAEDAYNSAVTEFNDLLALK